MNLGAFFAAPVWKRRKKPGHPLQFLSANLGRLRDFRKYGVFPKLHFWENRSCPAWTKNIDMSNHTTRKKLTTKSKLLFDE
jgi:hypothetical protein